MPPRTPKNSGERRSGADEALKATAARLRNILDQKTYKEKQTLKRYLAVLELKLERQARERKSSGESGEPS